MIKINRKIMKTTSGKLPGVALKSHLDWIRMEILCADEGCSLWQSSKLGFEENGAVGGRKIVH